MATQLYWREHRTGQRLYLRQENGEEVEVGGVRRTPRGFDALAKTMTYDPGRAKKDFATIHEAKLFVESFRPWELFYYSDHKLKVELDVRPLGD
ncbi:MAG: hypothetical protein HY666_04490 [Chloroflexi bacterium]|nr:hypothetical protein [Chloroflexota bacterium]